MEWGVGCCCGGSAIVKVKANIYRTVYPSLVSDYDGVSTDSIGYSTAGTWYLDPVDKNIFYFLLYTSDVRSVDASAIIGPIRWQIDIPTSNGGTYDYWQSTASTYKREAVAQAGFGYTQQNSGNLIGLCKTLLPASGDSHCIPPSAINVTAIGTGALNGSWIRQLPVDSGAFAMPDIDALIGGDLAWNVGTSLAGFWYSVYQLKDYVNGVLYDGSNPPLAGDEWYRDVWYKVEFNHSSSFSSLVNPLSPGRWFGIYWAESVVSNGSRRTGQSRIYKFADYEVGGTKFDSSIHTYQLITVGSHTWTLPGGSSGPEIIKTTGSWVREVFEAGPDPAYIRWRYTSTFSNLVSVTITFGQEIVLLTLEFKSTFASSKSINTKISYTPKANGNYLSSTYHTDAAATVTHCDLGTFDQEGTTEFVPVKWDVNSADWDGANYNLYNYRRGNIGGTPSPSVEAPTSIFVTRKLLSASVSSTTYNSGSGNFTVPSGIYVIVIEGWGAGGGGGGGGDGGANQAASGGAQGGYFRKTITVSPGDLIAYVVGSAGTGGAINFDGTDGGATTVDGGTYTANGGAKGLSASSATTAGGTASGGYINTTGLNGSGRASSVAGGNGGGGALGGSGDGVAGANAVAPANGGGGGGKNAAGGNGANGRVTFSY